MENNLFISGALYLFIITALSGCAKSERAPDAVNQDTQPNIVLILTDDQAYGDTSAFEQDAYTTPNIDSIANNGVMLTDFYVSQPVCSTSRASILTGAYANRLGISYAFFRLI